MMTKRRGKTNEAILKTCLVLGSVMATFFGGDLLARRAPELATTAIVQPVTNDMQVMDSTERPIIKLIIPDPITTSQSSR